jgi:hypothetical protein
MLPHRLEAKGLQPHAEPAPAQVARKDLQAHLPAGGSRGGLDGAGYRLGRKGRCRRALPQVSQDGVQRGFRLGGGGGGRWGEMQTASKRRKVGAPVRITQGKPFKAPSGVMLPRARHLPSGEWGGWQPPSGAPREAERLHHHQRLGTDWGSSPQPVPQ